MSMAGHTNGVGWIPRAQRGTWFPAAFWALGHSDRLSRW